MIPGHLKAGDLSCRIVSDTSPVVCKLCVLATFMACTCCVHVVFGHHSLNLKEFLGIARPSPSTDHHIFWVLLAHPLSI